MNLGVRGTTAGTSQSHARYAQRVSNGSMAAQDDNFDPLDESRYRPAFDVVLRGYDRRQVDDALSTAENEIGSLQQERELAYERLTHYANQIEQLQLDVYSLNQHLKEAERAKSPDRAAVTAQVQEILELAETEAGKIRATAQAEVEQLRDSADETLARARLKSEQLAETAQVLSTKLLDEAQKSADTITTTARQAAEQATATAAKDAAIALETATTTRDELLTKAKTLAEKLVAKARVQAQAQAAEAIARSEAVHAEATARHNALEVELAHKRRDAEAEITELLERQRQAATVEAEQTRQRIEHELEQHKRESEQQRAAMAKQALLRGAEQITQAEQQAASIVAKAQQDGQAAVVAARNLASGLVARARAQHEEITKETSSLTADQARITAYLSQMQNTLTTLDSKGLPAGMSAPVESKLPPDEGHSTSSEKAILPAPPEPLEPFEREAAQDGGTPGSAASSALAGKEAPGITKSDQTRRPRPNSGKPRLSRIAESAAAPAEGDRAAKPAVVSSQPAGGTPSSRISKKSSANGNGSNRERMAALLAGLSDSSDSPPSNGPTSNGSSTPREHQQPETSSNRSPERADAE